MDIYINTKEEEIRIYHNSRDQDFDLGLWNKFLLEILKSVYLNKGIAIAANIFENEVGLAKYINPGLWIEKVSHITKSIFTRKHKAMPVNTLKPYTHPCTESFFYKYNKNLVCKENKVHFYYFKECPESILREIYQDDAFTIFELTLFKVSSPNDFCTNYKNILPAINDYFPNWKFPPDTISIDGDGTMIRWRGVDKKIIIHNVNMLKNISLSHGLTITKTDEWINIMR